MNNNLRPQTPPENGSSFHQFKTDPSAQDNAIDDDTWFDGDSRGHYDKLKDDMKISNTLSMVERQNVVK